MKIELSHQEYKSLTGLYKIAKNEYEAALKAGHGAKNPGKNYKVLRKVLSYCEPMPTSSGINTNSGE